MTHIVILLESQATPVNPLAEGVTALISGMLTVFLILILIAFVISRIQHIKPIGREPKKRPNNEPSKLPSLDPTPARIEGLESLEEEDVLEEELIAVIMATIAASMDTTVDQLVVRSFKRLHSNRRIR